MVKVNPQSTWGERAWGGWSLLGYIPFFLYGFIVIAHEGLQESIKRWRWLSLVLTIIGTVGLAYANDRYGGAVFGSREYMIVNGLFGGNAWLWSVTILGFGMRRLDIPTRFLSYVNEAVLPFYILHQTVLLGVGYYIVRWNIPDTAKFAVIAVSSFAIIIALYEFLIRRVNALRFLFGMKAKKKDQVRSLNVVATSVAQNSRN